MLIPINKATLTKIVCLSLVMRSKPAEFYVCTNRLYVFLCILPPPPPFRRSWYKMHRDCQMVTKLTIICLKFWDMTFSAVNYYLVKKISIYFSFWIWVLSYIFILMPPSKGDLYGLIKKLPRPLSSLKYSRVISQLLNYTLTN